MHNNDAESFFRDFKNCHFETLEGTRWGTLITPIIKPSRSKLCPIRIVLFGSFWAGQTVLETLRNYLKMFPDLIELVGVATDDPLSPRARISLHKRMWSLMSQEERAEVMHKFIFTAVDMNVPVYTGEIKTEKFREKFKEWNANLILTCGFGQVLDVPLFEVASLGAYNFHPTDLANGHGAGPKPWEDMSTRGVTQTLWSIHQMTPVIDVGRVIGQSPPFSVADEQGHLVHDPLSFIYKSLLPLSWMAAALFDSLLHNLRSHLSFPLEKISVDNFMTQSLQTQFLEPIRTNWRERRFPDISQELRELKSDSCSLRLS